MLEIVIVGKAATGKTTMTIALQEWFQERGFDNIMVKDPNIERGTDYPHLQGDRIGALKNIPITIRTIETSAEPQKKDSIITYNFMKLYALAKKFENKYLLKTAVNAEEIRNSIVAHIQQSIANASTVSQSSGIMPFVQMLAQDNGKLTFSVTHDGTNSLVQNLSCQPSELTNKYQALPAQITNYLNKNYELFPSRHNGETVSYKQFTFTCRYGEEQGIASLPE